MINLFTTLLGGGGGGRCGKFKLYNLFLMGGTQQRKRKTKKHESEIPAVAEDVENVKPHSKKSKQHAGDAPVVVEDVGPSRWVDLFYQPIKDLADNWNIDLEDELSEYMKQLENIHEGDLENLSTGDVNFAEAAIVIQGSAMIYSKKVEYLYKLMFEVLDAIISKKRKEHKATSSVEEDGKDADVSMSVPIDRDGSAHVDFIPLDDDMKVCDDKVLNLHEDGSLSYLEFLKRQRGKKILNQTIPKGKGINSFMLANSFIDPSGFLYMDEDDGKLLRERTTEMSQTYSKTSTSGAEQKTSTADLLPIREEKDDTQKHESAGPNEGIDVEMQDINRQDDFDDDDGDMDVVDDAIAPEQVPPPATDVPQAPATPQPKADQKRVSNIPDPWEMLDPYDDSGSEQWHHPLKIGNPCRKLSKAAIEKQTTKIDFLEVVYGVNVNKPKKPRYACFPENEEDIRKELTRRRLQRKREVGKGKNVSPQGDDEILDQEHMNQPDNENLGEEEKEPFGFEENLFDAALHEDVNMNLNHDDPIQMEGRDEVLGGFEEPDLWAEDDVSDLEDDLPNNNPEGNAQSSHPRMTWEEQCRRKMDEFMKKLENFAEQTDLTVRVKEWETRIRPLLDEEESHPAYDIKEYGQNLMQTVERSGDKSTGKPKIHFEQAMHGMEQFQVCRYFLATLQLANLGKVYIEAETERQSLCVTLL
jgi:condensin-2 complex subunit H2